MVPAATEAPDVEFDFGQTNEPEFDQWAGRLLGARQGSDLLQTLVYTRALVELAPIAFPQGSRRSQWWEAVTAAIKPAGSGPD